MKGVVDEQQHVAMFVVAEILGHRQGDVPNAEPAARWFVHLAKTMTVAGNTPASIRDNSRLPGTARRSQKRSPRDAVRPCCE
jgi:hypothetical protein